MHRSLAISCNSNAGVVKSKMLPGISQKRRELVTSGLLGPINSERNIDIQMPAVSAMWDRRQPDEPGECLYLAERPLKTVISNLFPRYVNTIEVKALKAGQVCINEKVHMQDGQAVHGSKTFERSSS